MLLAGSLLLFTGLTRIPAIGAAPLWFDLLYIFLNAGTGVSALYLGIKMRHGTLVQPDTLLAFEVLIAVVMLFDGIDKVLQGKQYIQYAYFLAALLQTIVTLWRRRAQAVA